MKTVENNIYKIRYTSTLANIDVNKKRTRFISLMLRNKLLFLTSGIFSIAMIFDGILIYRFFEFIKIIK